MSNHTYTPNGYSKIQDSEKCLKYYDFRWNGQLVPKKVNENTLFGSVFHRLREEWYRNGKDPVKAMDVLTEFIDYAQAMGNDAFSNFIEYVLSAFREYVVKYKDDGIQHSALEVPFETTIGPKNYPITGRLDGVLPFNSMVWVDECKTTGSPIATFLRQMDMDAKTTCYVWAARKLTGYDVQGAFLDIIHKKRNKSGFEFHRDVTLRSPEFIERWERAAIYKLDKIEEARQSGYWPHNWASCYNFYGVCPYVDLCKFGEREELLATFQKAEDGPEGGENGGSGD